MRKKFLLMFLVLSLFSSMGGGHLYAQNVAKIGDTEYATFDAAIKAANNVTGNVTVEIYGEVEYSSTTEDLTGAYNNISFVGKTDNAKISITRNGQGGYISGGTNDCNVSFTDLILSKPAGYYADDAGNMNNAFTVYRVGSVSYTECSFPNGACAAGCPTSYTECTFKKSHDKYAVWAYGSSDINIDECVFYDDRGIKMYAEGAAKTTAVTVKNCDFSRLTGKPAIVATLGKSITLSDNTYSDTGVLELEDNGSSNGIEITSTDAVTCISDAYPNGCGVLVNNKIYRTVAEAAAVATSGSTVTLLHNSTETVTLPAGVTLDKNGFTANGVTVKVDLIISTAEQLIAFAKDVNEEGNNYQGKFVELGANINLNGSETNLWTPIGKSGDSNPKFKGTFDGKGYTISNLYVKQEAAYHAAGLFGATNGTIKNFTIDGAYVESLSSGSATVNGTAVVAGSTAYDATIENVHVKNATVKGNRYVAGIVGYMDGVVKGCSVENVTIVATPDKLSGSYDNGDKVGGIVGYTNSRATKIADCELKGTVSIKGYRDIGGIVGMVNSSVVVADNTNSATVYITVDQNTGYYGDKAANAGEFIGRGTESSESTNNTTAEGATCTVETIPFTPIAQIGDVKYNDLHEAMVAAKAGETVKLVSNVDLAGTEWEPVSFKGIFDGQDYTIRNLTINKPGVSNTGFITSLNGTFKNVTFTNPTVTGGENTAIVAGRAGGGGALAENITINGTIKVETTHSGYARAAAIVGGWAYGNYKNITVDGGDKAASYIKHTGGGDGRYVAGIVGHADDVESYVNCTVKNITISGGWLCGAIAGPGPADGLASGCSVENIDMGADYSGGMFGWYYGSGTVKDAIVKDVTFTDGSTNNGIIGGYGQNADANVENLTFENVQNNNGAPLLDHVASIGNNHYFTFEAALDAVQDDETITLLGRTGDEKSTELEFSKAINFTITGTAPKYALPVVTFQNATVNIKDAKILIPELDARQNATINVINSTVHDAGGNSIAKSYYNGAINISGTSVVHMMQVTTMGYITLSDNAKLHATWQTNVYGNGLITIKDNATFNTAALHLTAKAYDGRDNTDEARVGKPAEIVVDGANFIVGSVKSDSGADYSYNSSKGINVGTVDGKSAILNIKNGGNVNIWMANGETTNFGAGATVNVNASTFNVACRAESGTVTLANNGTVYVTGASNLAAANVTGAGWFYMNGVKLDADTELIGAKVGFINGTNNIVGSTIENGFFSVGIGQNTAAEATATFAETNNIELGSVTVNVSEDAVIGGNGETYSGWVGSAYSADKTQHTYALNVENSLATFGYMHVSKDGAMTIKGHSDNKYTYDNANVDFYAGELIINGAVTLNGTDAWSKFTKMSVDHVDGVLNIANGTNFESSIHNGSNTSASLKFWKAGKVNIDATSKVEIDNETVLVEGAELNIASKNVIAKGAVTGAGAINLTDLDAKFTAQEGLTVNNGVVGNTDFGVAYIDGAYQLAGYIAQIGDEKYLTLQEAFAAAQDVATITMLRDANEVFAISNTNNVTLDMSNYTLTGAILPSTANVTIKNGSIINGDNSHSAIEINSGSLNLNDVNISSKRHAVRIDGEVTATINGGEYHGGKTEGTRHALNVSGAADVTITAGTFVGPKGTTADSGAAVNVQTGAKVSIEGGDFTGGKNNTLAADGTLTVTGGTFDQDPSIYVPTGYVTVLNSENKYQVSKGVAKIVVDETTTYYASLSAAIAAAEEGQTIVLLAHITEDVTFDKALTLDGNNNSFNYTGKISLSKNIDFSVMNTNFYNGTLHLDSKYSKAKYNITGCNFNSDASLEWPMHLAGANEINIVNCKSEGYSRFLYLCVAEKVNVNNVTITGTTKNAIVMNEVDINVTLENVTMNGSALFIDFLKSYSKNNTVTIKNSNITAANGIIGNSADMTNKIVFEGATELNQDIFSGENDLRDKVTVVAEALIGTKVYGKFDDALAVVQEGETINVINPVVVTENKEYDFTEKTIVGNEVYPVIRIQNDANVTVTGEGSITNDDYVFVLGASDDSSAGNLTIENGTFTGTTTVASVTKGNLSINGGEFKVNDSEYGATYMINCIDANYNDEEANILISGGTFYGFNPQNNAAEGANTNFCADGFGTKEIEDNVWKVFPMQTTQLNAGWNWFSAYVETDLASLQNALVENLNLECEEDCNITIKDHYIGTITYYPEIEGWYGNDNFTSFEYEKMYMIQTPTNVNLQIVGEIVNPEEHPISIKNNWNVIGYILDEEMSLSTALSSISPVQGDYIKSKDGYAQYYEGIGWYGTINTMIPGQGYKLQSVVDDERTLVYPTTRGNNRSELKANVTTDGNYWTPNASQYANNMTITAMVDVEGGDYEVAAFVDGEVRGSARPIYVEALDSYILFLTIHGEGVEEMTFKFYDLATGEEFDLNDRMSYSDDAIVGSIKEPYMFNRGTTGIGEASLSDINIYPNPTTTGTEINLQATCDKVEVFNALGVKVAEYQNVDSIDAIETAGIYVIRITNNGNVQNCRLVVK